MSIPSAPTPELCLSCPDQALGPGWQQSATPQTQDDGAKLWKVSALTPWPGQTRYCQAELHCLGSSEILVQLSV